MFKVPGKKKSKQQLQNHEQANKQMPQNFPSKKAQQFTQRKRFAKLVSFGETFKALFGSLSGSLSGQLSFKTVFSKNVSSSCQRELRTVRVPTSLSRAMHFANSWTVILLLI